MADPKDPSKSSTSGMKPSMGKDDDHRSGSQQQQTQPGQKAGQKPGEQQRQHGSDQPRKPQQR